MYKFKHCLIAILIAFLAISCSRKLAPPEVAQRDSTVSSSLIEKVRDTVIVVSPDSSLVLALLECDSLNRVRIKEILSYKSGRDLPPPALSIKNNVLTVQANSNERKLFLQLKDRYFELLRQKNEKAIQTAEIHKLYWYQKTLLYTGIVALAYMLLLLIFKKIF